MKKYTLLFFLFLFTCSTITLAQLAPIVYYKGAIKSNKILLQRNIIKNTIINNLSLPLTPDTEENWVDAFAGMELLQYRSPWTSGRIAMAFDSIKNTTDYFKRGLMELMYANYDDRYTKQVITLMENTNNVKVYAMGAEYIRRNKTYQFPEKEIHNNISKLVSNEKDEAIARQLLSRIGTQSKKVDSKIIATIFDPGFLKNSTVLFSFQRPNRNYPGLAVVRDSTGKFVLDDYGNIFSVPQLARSLSNLPGYLTNGNTPQGIFRMYGFDTSKSDYIGPTTNVQLTMPFETSLQHFFGDSTITDTEWTLKWYKQLLPNNIQSCKAMYESFYAGQAGRTEIIAHGTTVNPDYYRGESYYPQTPTAGCLCTKELWSETDGKRIYSDQQKLVAALQKAGGPIGYCVVIELNDEDSPVSLQEILPWIKNNK
ncbi:hypothetical protein BH11BAC3_BH11BAC3_10540 [soil metagenome]